MIKADTALMAIPTPGNGERDKWRTIGMAYKAAGGTLDVFDQWSRKGDGYNERDVRDTWNSIDATGGITEKTLYKTAIANGWKDPEMDGSGHGGRQMPQDAHKAHEDAEKPINPAKIRTDIENALEAEKETGTAREYFKARGFTDATIDRFNIGFDPCYSLAGTKEPRAIIPYPGADYYTARRLSAAGDGDGKKYLYPPKAIAGGKRAFNVPALTGGAEIVYIVEGQLDAMTIEQEGGAAIGSNEPGQLLDALAAAGSAVTAKAFVIVPDMDDNGAGAAKARKMLDALTNAGKVAYIRELPAGIHDCNDSLKRPGMLHAWIMETPHFLAEEKTRAQAEKRKEFDLMTAGGRLESFCQEIRDSRNTKEIPTGFFNLDTRLDGGLYAGLYIIGAISSLGKTTFALQMIDQIAKGGKDCLVFSLEMAASELMARSVSRITDSLAIYPSDKKTMRGIMAGAKYANYNSRELKLINDAIAEYGTFAGNICIVEGCGDIGAEQMRVIVDKYVAAHDGRAPVVMVDYLQILAPTDPHATDKQNADRAVTELKRISRDYKTPVIAISSFNRENYNAGVSMAAFKESGAIEYSSDVLFGLQLEGAGTKEFNVDSAKKKTPRKIQLVILKNRNGKTGAKIAFDYDQRFNVFREGGVSDDDLPNTSDEEVNINM